MKILLALTLLLTLQQPAVDAPIKIAIIVPVEGPVAETGAAERAALGAYIDETNKRGGFGKLRPFVQESAKQTSRDAV